MKFICLLFFALTLFAQDKENTEKPQKSKYQKDKEEFLKKFKQKQPPPVVKKEKLSKAKKAGSSAKARRKKKIARTAPDFDLIKLKKILMMVKRDRQNQVSRQAIKKKLSLYRTEDGTSLYQYLKDMYRIHQRSQLRKIPENLRNDFIWVSEAL